MNRTYGFSRREFLAHTSCFGAFYALASRIPLPNLAAKLAGDSRVSQTPLVDKGFASVRKIGNGLYATVSDPSKGPTTICNGGFLIGRDAALLIEGFTTPAGASFQMDALRMVSQVPVKAALDTHYHFDHSMGNAFYGVNNVPLWGSCHGRKTHCGELLSAARGGQRSRAGAVREARQRCEVRCGTRPRAVGPQRGHGSPSIREFHRPRPSQLSAGPG